MIANFESLMQRFSDFMLITTEESKHIDDFLLWVEVNTKKPTDYIRFVEGFNLITGRKYTPTIESRNAYYQNNAIYSLNDRLLAVKNAMKNDWLVAHPHKFTPVFILQKENTAQYMKYEPENKNNGNSTNNPETKNYNEI